MVRFFHFVYIFAIFLLQESYGKRPSKIVGGSPARINDFPWVVSVQNWGMHFCGGVLITKRHVLTAAHCLANLDEQTHQLRIFDNEAFTIAAGSSNAKVHNRVYEVEKMQVHPFYTGEALRVEHDIGIVTMKEEAVLDETVQVIRLPNEYCSAGQLATVLGWGYLKEKGGATSEWLQKAPVNILSNADCMQRIAYPITQNHLCGLYSKGIGFCDGDSGGPLILKGQVVAVVSMGYACGSGNPDIYTRVHSYLPWINQVIHKNN